MREYKTLKALRRGEVIDFDGIKLKQDEGEIKPGNLYVAERNTGLRLLTAREIVMSKCGCCVDFILPTCDGYAFDGGECVKVAEAA
jgi:hypothetical protein